jgi:hypothetical protein
VFSDIWGTAIDSFGNKNHYVSFIDEFSTFTWIYLLHYRSEVFKFFKEFQNLVERLFNRKIISMQTDWGGESMSASTPSSIPLASLILSHAPMHISKMGWRNVNTTISLTWDLFSLPTHLCH